MIDNNLLKDKSFNFALRCVKLYKILTEERKEFIISKQFLRSGTSIGANIKEAIYAQSRADFGSKLSIAKKEAGETEYWLELIFRKGKMTKAIYRDLRNQCGSIRRRLIASITTAKNNPS